MRAYLIAIAVLLVLAAQPSNGWKKGAGDAIWDLNCDFYGNDIGREQTAGEDCSRKCAENSECTHFTYRDGWCYLKRNKRGWVEGRENGPVCGYIKGRSCQDCWGAADPYKRIKYNT